MLLWGIERCGSRLREKGTGGGIPTMLPGGGMLYAAGGYDGLPSAAVASCEES